MTTGPRSVSSYAYLPEDLLVHILEKTPETAEKLAQFIGVNEGELNAGLEILAGEGVIQDLPEGNYSNSLIAVDGANIIERMTGSDILMAIAVGVEGLPDEPAQHWVGGGEQYYQWQDALPHHIANSRLCQGIMFLMELSILARSEHQIRIMDGSHITPILKLNSLLSAEGEEFADEHYVKSLNDFLLENYDRIIPDIPDIIDEAFRCPEIIGMAKYSSSREILGSLLSQLNIPGDDKTFFSLALKEGQYTKPMAVGQNRKDQTQWEVSHIKCNLNLESITDNANIENELNQRFSDTLERFRPSRKGGPKLYFCYFKPFEHGICYRLEMKEELANEVNRLQECLRSIKRQIFFPDIHEPYPQYLSDIIAKNISFGMEAVMQAIRSHDDLNSERNFHLMMSYRSN